MVEWDGSGSGEGEGVWDIACSIVAVNADLRSAIQVRCAWDHSGVGGERMDWNGMRMGEDGQDGEGGEGAGSEKQGAASGEQ